MGENSETLRAQRAQRGIEKKMGAVEEQCRNLLSIGDVEQSFKITLEHGSSPFSASSVQMLGMLALRKGQFDEADKLIRQALSMKEDHISLKMAADSAFLQTKYADAEKFYKKALKHFPHSPEIHHDLGVAIVSQGRVDESLSYFAKASELLPERGEFHHHLALMLILAGQESAGWDRMQWRLRVQGVVGGFPSPEKYWRGESLEGKTIIIRTEQGWGDAFMFSSYLPWLMANAAKVYIYCQRPLMGWFNYFFTGIYVWPNDAPPPLDFDYHVAMMCLPRLCPPDAYDPPQARKGRGEGVGACWYGSPTHKADHLRTVPVERFEGVAEAAGGMLRCLGYGRFEQKPPFMDYYIDSCKDWLETSFRVQALDLVVTVDTAIAHLAAFLGVETWLLLPFVPDFRWLMTGETTKWYPSMKIYRQPKLFDWDSVFERVADDVRARYSRQP